MSEIRLKFDLVFSRRFMTTAGAIAMMLCAVPELESESVTLSTYYPAPSGVYTNMITTGNTYLARDGGRYINATTGSAVAIGVLTPVVNSKLTVSNGGISGTYGLTPSYTNWNSYGTGSGGAAIYNSNQGAYQSLMLVGNNSGGALRRVKVWDELTVNGRAIATDSDVTGVYVSRQGLACTPTLYGTPGPGITTCAAGRYVTFTTGVMVKRTYGSATTDPSGTMLCCPCPTTTGCPSL